MQRIPEPPVPYAVTHRRNKIIVGIIGLSVACLVGATLWFEAASSRPYVIFDGDPTEEARIDGVNVGPLRQGIGGLTFKGPTTSKHALVKSLAIGSHHLEIVDAQGKLLVDANVDVPGKGWRAVLTTTTSKRYGVVHATQQGTVRLQKVVPLTPGSSPHLFVVPPSERPVDVLELGSFDDKLLALDKATGTTVRICSLDAEGRPSCL